jgi:hypothetical protein
MSRFSDLFQPKEETKSFEPTTKKIESATVNQDISTKKYKSLKSSKKTKK